MMMTTKHNVNEKGFTLIEVLIAMVIFSIGILAVAQMQIRALHANSDAFDQTEASMWATNQAEDILAMPFASLTAGPYNDEAAPFYRPEDTANKYALWWTVADITAETKQVQLFVQWPDRTAPLQFNFVTAQSF